MLPVQLLDRVRGEVLRGSRGDAAGTEPGSSCAVVAESLLDRLINNSHQLYMNGPSYRPNKRPGQRGTTTAKEPSQ
jgi:hypothetical protein